jgi:hypothetical protein
VHNFVHFAGRQTRLLLLPKKMKLAFTKVQDHIACALLIGIALAGMRSPAFGGGEGISSDASSFQANISKSSTHVLHPSTHAFSAAFDQRQNGSSSFGLHLAAVIPERLIASVQQHGRLSGGATIPTHFSVFLSGTRGRAPPQAP